ncbi:MAG: xanthine dehydrogenase [Myxococcales bacterium SG8_38]|nr:MAG: xanthine dehydrogenase [Myxococcales bacterium SG8_38]
MKTDILDRVIEHVEAKRPIVLATDLGSGEQRLLRPGEGADESERATVQTALRLDKAITADTDEEPRTFYQPFNPPLRMVLVGAVHIAQPLSVMATLAGYEVTIIDPRSAFAASERFPGVELSLAWPDEALESLGLDARSAVVTLTHDPKLDDPALQVALRSDAFFIGCLGSAKTHAARLRRLAKEGFSETELQRLHGPVGLPIGSRSPAEIAVSVLAQITETLRRPAS